ncbi:MAG: hypothetical protein V4674_02090 [Patescibacteria group bacterium]
MPENEKYPISVLLAAVCLLLLGYQNVQLASIRSLLSPGGAVSSEINPPILDPLDVSKQAKAGTPLLGTVVSIKGDEIVATAQYQQNGESKTKKVTLVLSSDSVLGPGGRSALKAGATFSALTKESVLESDRLTVIGLGIIPPSPLPPPLPPEIAQ